MNVNDLTRQIIGFAFKIHNTLGFGFLESVYENAIKIELSRIGIEALQQVESMYFMMVTELGTSYRTFGSEIC